MHAPALLTPSVMPSAESTGLFLATTAVASTWTRGSAPMAHVYYRKLTGESEFWY